MRSSALAQALAVCIHARQPVFTWGPPGGGKTTIHRKVSKGLGYRFHTTCLSQVDVVDIRGMLSIVDGRSRYALPDWLPMERDPATVIHFDEFPQAPVLVMNGAAELVCERTLGGEQNYRLPPQAAITAAGNRRSDRAAVNEVPSHLKNRFVHLTLEEDVDDTIAFLLNPEAHLDIKAPTLEATEAPHPMVLAFLRFRPDLLTTFDPVKDPSPAFATRRSWGFVSRLLPFVEENPTLMLPMMQGCVGDGPGVEFVAFLGLLKSLPKHETVFTNPDTAPIPEEPSLQYAFMGVLTRHVTERNAEKFFRYLNRLSQDIAVSAVKDLKARLGAPAAWKPLFTNPEATKWVAANLQLIAGEGDSP